VRNADLAANPNADRAHYVDGMKFEPEVFDVVKNLDPQARQYVVVKNQFRRGDTKRFAARVTLDLSGIGRYTRVMSGSAPTSKSSIRFTGRDAAS
jgi:type IV secretion system protein VirB4